MLQFAFRIKLVSPEQYSVVRKGFSRTAGVLRGRDQREVVEACSVLVPARTAALGLRCNQIAAVLLIDDVTWRDERGRETGMRWRVPPNLFRHPS